jgi:glycosyltransferase involved in cell wall biosynthesis
MVAGRSRILFARRFESYRGVELQIAAARRLAAEFPACEWLFAGSGPLLAQVEDACRTIPNAKLLRADPKEMQRLHDEVDIAVIPSVYSEGTSFSCIEAMCAGCVPVVTDVGGLTNLVLPDFNGCIIRPTEVDLSGALRSLVKNVEFRRRVAANAFATASGAFSREAWLRRWADVLAEVEVKATPGIRQDRKQ